MERKSIDYARFRSTISGSDEHSTLDGAGEGGTPQKRMISCSSALVELPAAAASPGRGSVVRAGIT